MISHQKLDADASNWATRSSIPNTSATSWPAGHFSLPTPLIAPLTFYLIPSALVLIFVRSARLLIQSLRRPPSPACAIALPESSLEAPGLAALNSISAKAILLPQTRLTP